MIDTFSLDSLVKMVRQWALIDGDRSDAEFGRSDGFDIDNLIKMWIRQWYADAIENAPVELFPASEIDAPASIDMKTPWMAKIKLPDNFRRLVAFRMASWRMPPVILSADNPAHLRRWQRQASPYARAGASSPVVLVSPRDRTLYAVPVGASDKVALCSAVLSPGPDGPFSFSHSLLNSLSSYVKYLNISGA